MKILVIDTATSLEIVAACSGDRVSDQTKTVGTSHSVTLFNSIDAAIKEIKIEPKDLDLIGVGIGPGSFTGIRIAVTTGRMFSQIFDIPIVGLKTHLIYASVVAESSNPGENILIAFDAKKARVFGALYTKRNDGELIGVIEPGDYKIGDLLNKLNSGQRTLLIGDGCGKYHAEIKAAVKDYEFLEHFEPSGQSACGLVKKIFLKDPEEYRDLNKILPFYSRKPDAEILKK